MLDTPFDFVTDNWLILLLGLITLVVLVVAAFRSEKNRREEKVKQVMVDAALEKQRQEWTEREWLIELHKLQEESAERHRLSNRYLYGINTGVTIIVVIIILAIIFGCLSSTLGSTLLGL